MGACEKLKFEIVVSNPWRWSFLVIFGKGINLMVFSKGKPIIFGKGWKPVGFGKVK